MDEASCRLCELHLVARAVIEAPVAPLLASPVAFEPQPLATPFLDQWQWPARAPPFSPSSMLEDRFHLPEIGDLMLA